MADRLLRTLERIDDGEIGFGELTRRVGAEADRLGLPRPSYESVRVLARDLRARRSRPTLAQTALRVSVRDLPPEAFLDHLAGLEPPK